MTNCSSSHGECVSTKKKERERFLWLFLMIYISSIFSLLILYSFDVLPLKNVFFSSQKVKFEDFACHNSLLQLLMHLLLLLQEVQLSFNRINSLAFRAVLYLYKMLYVFNFSYIPYYVIICCT